MLTALLLAVGVPAVPLATDLLAAEEYKPAGTLTVAPLTVRSEESLAVPVGTLTVTFDNSLPLDGVTSQLVVTLFVSLGVGATDTVA